MVGRDDGVVEVYSMDDSNQPRLKYTHVSSPSSLPPPPVLPPTEGVMLCR